MISQRMTQFSIALNKLGVITSEGRELNAGEMEFASVLFEGSPDKTHTARNASSHREFASCYAAALRVGIH
jgi:hypothetical protein